MKSTRKRLTSRERVLVEALIEYQQFNARFTVQWIAQHLGVTDEAIYKIKRKMEKGGNK